MDQEIRTGAVFQAGAYFHFPKKENELLATRHFDLVLQHRFHVVALVYWKKKFGVPLVDARP